LHTAQESNNRR